MKEIFLVFRDRKCLFRMLISGLIFLLISSPFRVMMTLIPGMTEVRPANMIPPVLGILWGPAAAWGTAVANAISDIWISHSAFTVWFPGFLINFFFSYLPYRLWYSLPDKNGSVTVPNLGSVSDILRFIYVCLINSLATTTLLAMLFEILGYQKYSSGALLLFFNNFDFAIVLGIPAILLLSNFHQVGIWIPMELQGTSSHENAAFPMRQRKLQKRYDLFILLICITGLVYYILAEGYQVRMHPTLETTFCITFLVFEFLMIFKPLSSLRKQEENMKIERISIRSKVILGFLLLSVFFVLVIGGATYLSQKNITASQQELWQQIYMVVAVSLNILFVVSILFLKYVEVNITGSLETLSGIVKQFAGMDHRSDGKEKKQRIISTCQSIRTGDEIQALSESFSRMMTDIDNYVYNLAKMTTEKERISAELNIATQIQADMLPRIFPAFPDRPEFDVYASMNPAKEVGGDFYDFFLIDDEHLAIVIADVSGKGVPAALFMVIAKTLIKNHAQLGETPAEIFTNVNNQLCEGNEAGLFVTAWMGILRLTDGHFVYVNAGHNPPLLMKKDSDFEFLKTRPGFVLAGMEDIRYRQTELFLNPGERIYLYTDGVTEATNLQEHLYGEDRLKETLNLSRGLSIREMCIRVSESLQNFSGDADQFDDITMLAMEFIEKKQENRHE